MRPLFTLLYDRLGIASWTRTERIHATAVSAILLGAIVHHCVFFWWYIEDAAISFAYSKHLAMGEGLVPFVGGERVEGYSNPAWVFFLAPFSWLFDLHAFARWVQVLMVPPTVILTWFSAREVLGKDSHLALAAPAVLAISAQFALWGGAGLEIGLMNLLMAAALWRSLVEVRTGGWPTSALLWLGVTLCRPEAILYAAVAGFCAMVFHLHAGRGVLPTLKWLATYFVPFALYHGWRYAYFAWELPNTYYAKLERRPDYPLLDWAGKSWKYTRNFMSELGWGLFLPVWVLGIVGHTRWRAHAAAAISIALALTVELGTQQRFLVPVIVAALVYVFWVGLRHTEENPPPWLAPAGLGIGVALVLLAEAVRWGMDRTPGLIPVPDLASDAPPYALLAAGVLLPLLGIGSRGWQARMLTWLLCWAAVFFALVAQWDWMKGYRWYAPAVVPGSVLFAMGAVSLGHFVQRHTSSTSDRLTAPGLATVATLVGLTLVPNILHTVHVAQRMDTQPRHVRTRVQYVEDVRDRLHVEERFVDLDVDQGAHLYWSDFEMMDIAGLIEVPLAHHKFERAFVEQYLFEERRPHFIHIHGGWASSSRIPTFTDFRTNYVEIPGYVANAREFHIGNHVRRDLILADRWPHETPRVAMTGGVLLHGVHVPSEPASGEAVYLEIGVSSTKPRKNKGPDDFRLLLFAANAEGVLHTWDVAPGYDWIFPHEWKAPEVFVGKLDLDIPDGLAPGTYNLGVVAIGGNDQVVPPQDPNLPPDGVQFGGQGSFAPLLAHGEVVYPGALTVLSVDDNRAAADADRDAALANAGEGSCESGEKRWFEARMHRPRHNRWVKSEQPAIRRALAECFARRSDTLDSLDARAEALIRARELDHWAPGYRARKGAVADELMAAAHQAREAALEPADWEPAFWLFDQAVQVDRSRSWARRYAEEARAHWLKIDDASLAAAEERRTAKREEARKRRAKIQARRDKQQEPGSPRPPGGEEVETP